MADEEKSALELFKSADVFKSATAAPEPPPASEPTTPEPVAEAPSAPEPPKPETPIEPSEPVIPPWRLREESEARRLAEDRARALEARLNEVAAHIQQTQKQPDFFENPDAATQQLVLRALQPYAEETRRNLMYMGKMVASVAHGADKVEEAEEAFLKARDTQSLDPADYERVVQSPNRYDAVVQWHNRQSTLSLVGNDPNAWFEKQLEAKMADPQFQAKLLEKVRGDAASRPSANRLPPSLSKTTAAASNAAPIRDLSDQSLFAFATKR